MTAAHWVSLLVLALGIFVVALSPAAGDAGTIIGFVGNGIVGIGWGLKP